MKNDFRYMWLINHCMRQFTADVLSNVAKHLHIPSQVIFNKDIAALLLYDVWERKHLTSLET